MDHNPVVFSGRVVSTSVIGKVVSLSRARQGEPSDYR